VIWRPVLVTYLDNKGFDLLASSLKMHPPTNQVVIVDIDELSVAKTGKWPWPRIQIADLIQRLSVSNASVIALDVILPQSPNSIPARDDALSKAVTLRPSVAGFEFVFDTARNRATECLQIPKPLASSAVLVSSQSAMLPEASAIICDSPALESKVSGAGFLNALRDRDSAVRRLAVLTVFRRAIYPSFALAAARAGLQSSIAFANGNSLALQWGEEHLALSDRGEMLLRYRGRSLPHYSAAHILESRVPAEAFAGKIVVIGSSASGLDEDSFETASDRASSRVEVQATAIDNIIAGDSFHHPGWAELVEIAGVLATSGLVVWLAFYFPAPVAVAGTIAAFVAAWVLSQALLGMEGAFVSPVPAFFAGAVAMTLCALRILFAQGQLNMQAQQELVIANRFITGALRAMTAVRDVETGQHVVRIQGYLRSLCEVVSTWPRFRAYLNPQMIELMVQLAPIHDIGKVGVPDYILRKPTSLTQDEFEHMKAHVTLGKKILEEARQHSGINNEVFFQTATDIVYSHHERWDGTGYPLGLSGDDIPIPGRLLAVADVYDALISKRHYKSEILHAEAVEAIRQAAGTHFDPEIVEGFLIVQEDWRRMAEYLRDEPGVSAAAQ
jgi:adenylate cyclase